MQALESRSAKYEAEYASTDGRSDAETNSSGPAASAANALVVDRKEQRVKLAKMRTAFNNLQKIVDRLHKRIEEQERKLDDLEQYGRSNCLIVHRCDEVPNAREYLEHEKYVSNIQNQNSHLNLPLQVNNMDVTHTLPLKNNSSCSVIIKFLRRSQRNYKNISKER